MKIIKTVMKLILATLMHSKIKDFNFIHIISRISIKTSTSEGIKSVKQLHKNHLIAVPNRPIKIHFYAAKKHNSCA